MTLEATRQALEETIQAFEKVINEIQSILPKQYLTIDYMKLSGKLEAYIDSLNSLNQLATSLLEEETKKEKE